METKKIDLNDSIASTYKEVIPDEITNITYIEQCYNETILIHQKTPLNSLNIYTYNNCDLFRKEIFFSESNDEKKHGWKQPTKNNTIIEKYNLKKVKKVKHKKNTNYILVDQDKSSKFFSLAYPSHGCILLSSRKS